MHTNNINIMIFTDGWIKHTLFSTVSLKHVYNTVKRRNLLVSHLSSYHQICCHYLIIPSILRRSDVTKVLGQLGSQAVSRTVYTNLPFLVVSKPLTVIGIHRMVVCFGNAKHTKLLLLPPPPWWYVPSTNHTLTHRLRPSNLVVVTCRALRTDHG